MKKSGRNILLALIVSVLLMLAFSPAVFSHCEIPCGIYDDAMRLEMMAEHITTIEKSMKQIQELSEDTSKNYNQLVRWVLNKEQHADSLSDIVTQYFMKQRIKPVDSSEGQAYQGYVQKLTTLHKLMVYSMNCKQTADLNNVAKLKQYLEQFKALYLDTGNSASGPGHEAGHK